MIRSVLSVAVLACGLAIAGPLPSSGHPDRAIAGETGSVIPSDLSVREAHAAVDAGSILLVDIRSRGEWRDTGIAAGAVPISMHESGFLPKLDAAMAENPDRPVALICAGGVRSSHMRTLLLARGYRNIVDVPEGMLGSRAGPGWIRAGLPTVTGNH